MGLRVCEGGCSRAILREMRANQVSVQRSARHLTSLHAIAAQGGKGEGEEAELDLTQSVWKMKEVTPNKRERTHSMHSKRAG